MSNLPDVVLENIFERLSTEDKLTCACVCSQWNQMINQDIFWKRLLYKHFDIEPSEERLKSSLIDEWRKFYCVFNPFPFVLGCGVVTPYGFKFDSNYKSLVICLLYTSPSPRDS